MLHLNYCRLRFNKYYMNILKQYKIKLRVNKNNSQYDYYKHSCCNGKFRSTQTMLLYQEFTV